MSLSTAPQEGMRQRSRYTGDPGAFADVRLVSLENGQARGVRILEFRTETGLAFDVVIDRAMDVGDCVFKGNPVGWRSPTGIRHPGLHEYEGEQGLGWLRSFSGLFQTCGLDHILFMDDAPSPFAYAPRKIQRQSVHGRVAFLPAELTGYGVDRSDAGTRLWAEGRVIQAAVFGEHLEMRRRIEIDARSNRIELTDVVTNMGYASSPHMFCYHVNVGHPILDEGSEYLAPISDVIWAGHADTYRDQGVGYRVLGAPADGFHEQVWQHRMRADAEGVVPVALINRNAGLGFLMETRASEFPCHYEWQNLASGSYALGLEPSTNHVTGAAEARRRNEVIILEPGTSRSYHTAFEVLDGSERLQAASDRISAIATQPDGDYPPLSGDYYPLEAR